MTAKIVNLRVSSSVCYYNITVASVVVAVVAGTVVALAYDV